MDASPQPCSSVQLDRVEAPKPPERVTSKEDLRKWRKEQKLEGVRVKVETAPAPAAANDMSRVVDQAEEENSGQHRWPQAMYYNLSCIFCSKRFGKELSLDLIKHMQFHKDKDPRRHHLSNSGATQGDSKTFTCEVCGIPFRDPSAFRIHLLTVHTRNEAYQCLLCSKVFKWRSNFLCHLRVSHKSGSNEDPSASGGKLNWKERFVGIILQARYPVYTAEDLPEVKVNLNAKVPAAEVKVNVQVAESKDDDQVMKPKRVKRKPRPKLGYPCLKCVFCDKQYSCSSRLESHLLSHIGERPYFCLKCSKTFGYAGSLRRHCKANRCSTREGRRKHTGVVCEICGKRYKQAVYLKRHKEFHVMRFECAVCKQRFSDQGKVRRHLLACHRRK